VGPELAGHHALDEHEDRNHLAGDQLQQHLKEGVFLLDGSAHTFSLKRF
jgi:hypothetical protein